VLGVGDDENGSAGIFVLEKDDGTDGRLDTRHDNRIRHVAESRRHRRLRTGVHVQEAGEWAHDPRDVVGGVDEPCAGVLALKSDPKGLAPGTQTSPFAFSGRFARAQRLDLLVRLGELRLCRLVIRIKGQFAGVQAGYADLDPLKLVLRGIRSLTRLGDLHIEPGDLGLAGLLSSARGIHLTGEPCQSLSTVRRCALRLSDAAVLRGCGGLGDHPGCVRVRQCCAAGLDLTAELELLRAKGAGIGIDLLGIATRLLLRLRLKVLHAFGRQLHEPVEALTQPAEREPGLLGSREPRRVDCRLLLGQLLLREKLGDPGIQIRLSLAQGGLVGDLLVERLLEVPKIVGHEPEARVADLGLDDDGAARHLGLSAQRLQLTPQLGGEVLEPNQVDLHRVQLAERLLLALAVLEDARRLLDEAAAILGRGLQDRVELALTDDHMHLSPDAGVAEELLHVEQPARLAVDRVLRPTVAEEGPRDRHLGVVDGQGVVGVVDGQGHLRATQGGAAGGAGEDDVLHPAAPQRLRALLAHDPREGIHDIGLARPVGPDDARDTGLEMQGRG
jgi:hypothetical protein